MMRRQLLSSTKRIVEGAFAFAGGRSGALRGLQQRQQEDEERRGQQPVIE